VAARSRGASDPIAIVRLLEEGVTLFFVSLRFFSPAAEGSIEQSLVYDEPLSLDRPSPKLSQARNSRRSLVSFTLCVRLRQFFFLFLLIVSLSLSLSFSLSLSLSLSNIPLTYSYAQYVALAYNVQNRAYVVI